MLTPAIRATILFIPLTPLKNLNANTGVRISSADLLNGDLKPCSAHSVDGVEKWRDAWLSVSNTLKLHQTYVSYHELLGNQLIILWDRLRTLS